MSSVPVYCQKIDEANPSGVPPVALPFKKPVRAGPHAFINNVPGTLLLGLTKMCKSILRRRDYVLLAKDLFL